MSCWRSYSQKKQLNQLEDNVREQVKAMRRIVVVQDMVGLEVKNLKEILMGNILINRSSEN